MIPGPNAGAVFRCPKCHLGLDASAIAPGQPTACPACRTGLAVHFFPAFSHPPETVSTLSGEHANEGEAVCFFHPEKRAAISCERCGRFLCALCDVPFAGKHLCPSCLDGSKMPELINRRVVWGQMAFWIGFVPVLVPFCWVAWFMAFISGPAAIILPLWKWKAPGSLVYGRRRGMAIAGMIGGLLQCAGIAAIFFGIYRNIVQ